MSVTEPRWREIPGFPGYEVSEEGDVRCWIYRGVRVSTPRQILPYLSNSNRWALKMQVTTEVDGKPKQKRITMSLGVLILISFRGEPGRGEVREVDFADDNPYNINLSNLRWRKNLQKFKELT